MFFLHLEILFWSKSSVTFMEWKWTASHACFSTPASRACAASWIPGELPSSVSASLPRSGVCRTGGAWCSPVDVDCVLPGLQKPLGVEIIGYHLELRVEVPAPPQIETVVLLSVGIR